MAKLMVELPDELHTHLKQQAMADHKTLKVIVTSLLHQYLRQPRPRSPKRPTGLCGAWKDRRTAEELTANLRSARHWRARDGGRIPL